MGERRPPQAYLFNAMRSDRSDVTRIKAGVYRTDLVVTILEIFKYLEKMQTGSPENAYFSI